MSTTTILIKRNGTSGSVPAPSAFIAGELALNYGVADGGLYYRDGSGSASLIRAGTASFAFIAQNALSSSLTTTALNALNAVTSSYALVSQVAILATNATTASYAISASRAQYSATASVLLGAIESASFALTASYFLGTVPTAVSASYALNAGQATSAISSSLAALAVTASYALNGSGGSSVSASYATTASWAAMAATASVLLGTVISASYSLTASYALNAGVLSGGSNGGWYDPMALRAGQSASLWDDDWSVVGAIIGAGWTGSVYWPATTFDVGVTYPNHLYMRITGSSTHILGLFKPIPAGNFAVQTQIAINPNSANLSHAELILSDGTGSAANVLIIDNYQDGSSRSGIQNGTMANITANIVAPWITGLNPVVVRLERSSSVYVAEISPDGINGQRVVVSPGFTPTHFGIGAAAFTGDLQCVFAPFRYSPFSTTRWGAFTGGASGGSGGSSVSASYAATASVVTSPVISSSYAVTASYALNAGAGGSGGFISSSFTRDVVTLTTPSLGSASYDTGHVNLGPVFLLLQVSSSTDARIRLYAKDSYRDADLNRPIDSFPLGQHGVLVDVLTTGSDALVIDLAPEVIGANMETPVSASIAYSIQNRHATAQPITVSFTRLLLSGSNVVTTPQYATIAWTLNGGGLPITIGNKGFLTVDFPCVIESATLLADQTGSIVVDVLKSTYIAGPPTSVNTITGTNPPTITSDVKHQDTVLTGWTSSLSTGDVMGFVVNSVSAIQLATITLKVRKL